MNAYKYGEKVILSNGFHRAIALRNAGLKFIPIFMQNIEEPSVQLPPAIANLSLDTILKMTHPPRLKHYFDPNYYFDFSAIDQIKTITIQVAAGQSSIAAI